MLKKFTIAALCITLIIERLNRITEVKAAKATKPKLSIAEIDAILTQAKIDTTGRMAIKSDLYHKGFLQDNEETLEAASLRRITRWR